MADKHSPEDLPDRPAAESDLAGVSEQAPETQETSAAAPPRDEHAELQDKLLRAHAEFDNYRKRTQRERDEERRYAALPVARELLPVLDNLQRAIDAASQGGSIDDLRQGVEMVLGQARDVLARFQIRPIEAVGKAFDPHLHDALTQMPSEEHPPMTVLQEVERGYMLHDRVLRPTKVIVAAPKSE